MTYDELSAMVQEVRPLQAGHAVGFFRLPARLGEPSEWVWRGDWSASRLRSEYDGGFIETAQARLNGDWHIQYAFPRIKPAVGRRPYFERPARNY